jgi:hypothetical protein
MGLTNVEVLGALEWVVVWVMLLSSELALLMVRVETLRSVLRIALVVVVAVVAHMQFLISTLNSVMIACT